MPYPFEEPQPSPKKKHTPTPSQLATFVIHSLRCLVSWALIEHDMSIDDISMLVYAENGKLRETDLLHKTDWAQQPLLSSSITRLITRWFITVQEGYLLLTPTGQDCIRETRRLLEESISDDMTALIGCSRKGNPATELPTLIALREEFSS